MTIDSSASSPSFSRPTWAEINLSALRWNLDQLVATAGGCAVLAVVKANAYGHGAVAVTRALLARSTPGCVANMLGVASVDEGRQLREVGIEAPILLLSAILPEEANAVVEAGLTATVFTREVAVALDAAGAAHDRVVPVHLKTDTGMSRLGVWHCEAPAFFRELSQFGHLKVEGFYTHFACADEADETMTLAQLQAFERVLDECGINYRSTPADHRPVVHAANSAALLRFSRARFDMVRPGIALYGAWPSDEVRNTAVQLKPVMTLRSRITSVQSVPRGKSVSYGATWRAEQNSRVAVVPVGYADGYSRRLSNKGEVLIRDVFCPVVGRVTMDQILVDCTHLVPNVAIGENVTLFGSGLPVEDVAARAGTIAYEILCGVAPRVPRVYVE